MCTMHQLSVAEDMLNQFSKTRDCWKQCLYFLSHTSNEYVMMYCLTVLEVSFCLVFSWTFISKSGLTDNQVL